MFSNFLPYESCLLRKSAQCSRYRLHCAVLLPYHKLRNVQCQAGVEKEGKRYVPVVPLLPKNLDDPHPGLVLIQVEGCLDRYVVDQVWRMSGGSVSLQEFPSSSRPRLSCSRLAGKS